MSQPPPRPPPAVLDGNSRLNPLSSQYGYSSVMQPYMGMAYGNYGMQDPYNRLGMFNSINAHNSPEGNFVRLAEESSKNAFQSIEAIVGAIASVANMLNSTHNAVFSSFRAVIGVVEQFRFLKTQFISFLLAVFRRLRIFWRRCLILMQLKPRNYAALAESELVWSNMSAAKSYGTNWVAMLFWLVALGGPYLIYKCISQMVKSAEESKKWALGDGEHYTAQALYDFDAANSQELSFRASDILRVAPKSEQPQVRDWILASTNDGQQIGLVPITYIKLLNRNITTSPPLKKSPLDEGSFKTAQNSTHQYSNLYESIFTQTKKP